IQRAYVRTRRLAGQTPLRVERHHPRPAAAGAGLADLLGLAGRVPPHHYPAARRNGNAINQLRPQRGLREGLRRAQDAELLGVEGQPVRDTNPTGCQQQSEDEAMTTAALDGLLLTVGLLGTLLGVAAREGGWAVLPLLAMLSGVDDQHVQPLA